jgi:HEAT repeat protein
MLLIENQDRPLLTAHGLQEPSMQAIYHTSYTPIYAQIELVDPEAEEPYRPEQWVEEDAPAGFLGPHGLVVSTMNDVDVDVTVFEGPGQLEGRLGLSGAIQIGAHGLELGTISQRDRIAWPAGWTSVSVFVNAWPGTEVTQVALVLEWLGLEPPPASALQPGEQARLVPMSWQELTDELAVERLVAAVRAGAALPGYLGLRAIVALGMLVRQHLLALLADPSPRVRLLAVRALGQNGSQALGLVLNARSPEEHRQALEALDQLATQVLEPLCRTLRDEDATVRREMAYQLCMFGKSSQKAAVAPLIEALHDPDPDVRSSAALALGASEDPRALEPLVQRLLQRDELPIARRCAAEGLAYLQDRRATSSLLRMVEQPQEDHEVRLFAARALVQLAEPQAVELFQRVLRDQQAPTKLRKVAADGVGALGDSTALPMLAEVLDHLGTEGREEQSLKEHISWAIEGIKERYGA